MNSTPKYSGLRKVFRHTRETWKTLFGGGSQERTFLVITCIAMFVLLVIMGWSIGASKELLLKFAVSSAAGYVVGARFALSFYSWTRESPPEDGIELIQNTFLLLGVPITVAGLLFSESSILETTAGTLVALALAIIPIFAIGPLANEEE